MTPARVGSLALTVTALELASGLPMGFVSDFVPVWARSVGESQAVVGALGAVAGIWSAKVLWGPWVDNVWSYKAWGLAALTAMLAAAVAGASWPAAAVAALVALGVFGGLLDVAFDAWLITATPAHALGQISGLRVAAYRTAMALGGGGAIWLGGRYGWAMGWWLVAALLALLLLGLWRVPGPTRAATGERQPRFVAALLAWLLRRDTLAVVAAAVLYRLGDALTATMSRAFWVDVKLTTDQMGLLGALGGSVLTAAGALLGGALTGRLGLPRALAWLGASQVLSNAVYGLVAISPSPTAVLGAGAFEALTTGLGAAPLVTLLISATEGPQPATRFAALTAAAGLTRAVASAVSGVGAQELGYAGWFGVTAVVGIPGVLLAFAVARDRLIREFGPWRGDGPPTPRGIG